VRIRPALCTTLALLGCGAELERPMGPDVLAVGDSVLEWNLDEQRSIPEVFADRTGLGLTHAAVGGAMMLADEESIPGQYVEGDWRVVIIDGGANDLGPDGCGCGDCVHVMDEIISPDLASGAMVDLVERARNDGAEVLLLGYYAPAPGSEFDGCEEELAVSTARMQALAEALEGVRFVDASTVVDWSRDPSHYAEDGIHPSPSGSAVIGNALADRFEMP
jgi:lysophospholipase L1-like esterase